MFISPMCACVHFFECTCECKPAVTSSECTLCSDKQRSRPPVNHLPHTRLSLHSELFCSASRIGAHTQLINSVFRWEADQYTLDLEQQKRRDLLEAISPSSLKRAHVCHRFPSSLKKKQTFKAVFV